MKRPLKHSGMKKVLKWLVAAVLTITIVIPVLLYFLQGKMLFHPHKTAANKQLNFPGN